MKNVMIDIETLGSASNAVIVSIAAVKFNFGNDDQESFYTNCNIKSSIERGMGTDASTLQWWKDQPEAVQKALLKDQLPIDQALDKLTEFLGDSVKDMSMWANGIAFDYPILEWSYKACGKTAPWKYYNVRDARTIYKVMDLDLREFPRVGDHHNALDDCRTQIAALKSVLI